MYLENISLINFKNYKEVKISFCERLNCIIGSNGSGKTNLLDAIHYLSLGRSALNIIDAQNINHDESFFTINGSFVKESKKFKVSCQLQKGEKKTLFINKKKVDKISDFIGNFPVVLITPNDNEVIKEGSEIRRNFFDNIFSQIDRTYLITLIDYIKALKSRNSLLKQFVERNSFDSDLLEPYDRILAEKGKLIFILREKYLAEFVTPFINYFNLLTNNTEAVSLVYKSSLSGEDILLQFKKALPLDRSLQRTTIGIHKDDFIFTIKDYPLKKFGSQGQQKSFLISLKLAHYSIINKYKNIKPILLLDDIFDKLDESRIKQLLEIVLEKDFGQVFITDARSISINSYIQNVTMEKAIFEIKNNISTIISFNNYIN